MKLQMITYSIGKNRHMRDQNPDVVEGKPFITYCERSSQTTYHAHINITVYCVHGLRFCERPGQQVIGLRKLSSSKATHQRHILTECAIIQSNNRLIWAVRCDMLISELFPQHATARMPPMAAQKASAVATRTSCPKKPACDAETSEHHCGTLAASQAQLYNLIDW